MMTNQTPDHKEEKLAAARQKLKEFKKRNEHQNGTITTHDINDTSGRSSPSSVHSSQSLNTSKFLNLTSLNETQLNYQQVKEQLQLHVQTIGILVAEKAELQSKLQQQVKKSDKKQDECDELMGRLKASRQKISDLERIIQQLSQQDNNVVTSHLNEHVQNELNSKDLVIDEFKIRLHEMNEKLSIKSQECQKFAQLSLDLKSQLEILQLKLNKDETNESHDFDISKLKQENDEFKNELKKYEQEKSDLKAEYQSYVERLQKQVENLVDQINRLTDEREESFQKIDSLSFKIKTLQEENTSLLNSNKNQKVTELTTPDPKLDILENEVKYFKQQIDILLHEQANFNQIVEEKNLELENLSKLVDKYESDRDKFNSILEQNHNDKQTISRILKQNNELKSQLEELEGVYVKVTNENLDLTTRLESFKFKENVEPSPEWDDDVQQQPSEPNHQQESLMNSVKQRLLDLENENKDLNDYIALSNEKLNEHVNLIAELTQKIKRLETTTSGQSMSDEYVNNMKLVEEKFKKVMEQNAELKEKNQELEHVIEQLQFETESIVDYITMYQMERSKLTEKYKIKDEFIRSLSTQLQVNKLALLEINNYLSAFMNLSGEDNQQKREFVLAQVQGLLSNLTQTSSSQLSSIEHAKETQLPILKSTQIQTQEQLEKSISKFRTETIICSSCYGDLFII